MVFTFFSRDPSPDPLRLVRTPAAGHPLPPGRGLKTKVVNGPLPGERVARVASRLRDPFLSSLVASEFGFDAPVDLFI